MANLLEEVALLAYRDDNGRNGVPYLEMSLSGAALMELALIGRITIGKHGRVGVADPLPVGHPALDNVLKRISGSKDRHTVASWVQIMSGVDMHKQVLSSLTDQHILTCDQDRLLGLLPVNRYHPAEPRVEAEIRARLDRTFNRSSDADVRTAALAGIVSATFMETVALPQHKQTAVHKVFSEISQSDPVVKKVIEGTGHAVAKFKSSFDPLLVS